MSTFVPDAPTLLRAAADYLEAELLPTLDGYHRFQSRVTLNVIRIVIRELELAPALREAERARLAALLGHDGELDSLDAEFACAIADGHRALDEPAVLDHLRQTLRDALSLHNPKWAPTEPSSS